MIDHHHPHIREAKSHFGIFCRTVQIFVPHENSSFNHYFTFKELCCSVCPELFNFNAADLRVLTYLCFLLAGLAVLLTCLGFLLATVKMLEMG